MRWSALGRDDDLLQQGKPLTRVVEHQASRGKIGSDMSMCCFGIKGREHRWED